jgi:hypothetical protein
MNALANDWDYLPDRLTQLRSVIPASVRLIAVTKTFPAAAVRAAYQAGMRDFGESKVQEAIAKQAELADLQGVTWHLIGHLQGNKVRKALQHFSWIHSVDSLKLAEALNHQALELGCRPTCCLQVKIVPDPNKYGFTPAALQAALPQLDRLHQLDLAGLMTIPPYGLSPADTQAIFEQTRQLAAAINQQGLAHLHLQHLSMGMSGDFPLAIASGATLIRLGTALFGQRNPVKLPLPQ